MIFKKIGWVCCCVWNSDNPMYTDYYGLTAKPFQLNPDPRFFFGSSVHRRALAYLRYGLSQAEGFIVITGGIGTGKTTLVRSLLAELDPDTVVAAQLVTTQLEADDLLRMVVAAFELPHANLSKAELIKRFEMFLRDCADDGKRVLLLVDEAQNLPTRSLEELRMLSNFQVSDTPLLQSFLLGQEEFRASLQAPGMEQLCQRVIASCHLSPLNVQETRDYIEHRLQVVGWRNRPRFNEGAYQVIHQHTRGVPRRINIFCDRVLLYAYLEELAELSGENIESVAAEFDQELFNTADAEQNHQAVNTPTTDDELALNTRLQDLEESVAALLLEPNLQDVRLEGLERRLKNLERGLETLTRELLSTPRQG